LLIKLKLSNIYFSLLYILQYVLYLSAMTLQKVSQEPFRIVIFGSDGDLSFRKIFPALYYRLADGQVNDGVEILAASRTDRTQEEYIEMLRERLEKYLDSPDKKVFNKLLKSTTHLCIKKDEEQLKADLMNWFEGSEEHVRIFYLATPASAFGTISDMLLRYDLITPVSRIVLEKPLGTDLKSSEDTNSTVAKYFDEDQIYRIDHYLGKETVQNLMVLRFANNLFERTWNAQHIDNVQITVAESLGVGSRGGYYDQSGALRDMVQNHLLQLLCLVGMDPPLILNADEVRDEKLKVLKALRPFTKETIKSDTIKGQYTRGSSAEGHLPSYLEDIEKYSSQTETFVALKTYIDNWRWEGVPFYLRTGKRLPHRYSEIIINYKSVPHNIFPEKKNIENNRLAIRLQPEERIELLQMVKIPGPGGYRYKPISLELDYADHFDDRFPDAYERLLMDVVRGNQTLFMRRDEVKASWAWIETILVNWKKQKMNNELYEAGSWGPGNKIMNEGHHWVTSKHIEKIQKLKKDGN